MRRLAIKASQPVVMQKLRETLNKPSHRRKPVSNAFNFLDFGFRRNDDLRLDQWLLKYETMYDIDSAAQTLAFIFNFYP